MKLERLELSEIAQRVPSSVGNPRHSTQERRGLLLGLVDGDGQVGFGEASPLPGYSPDTLEASKAALSALSAPSIEAAFLPTRSFVENLRAAAGLLPRELPAARFALETALLDLACIAEGRSPFELLERRAQDNLTLAALLQNPEPAALERELAAFWARGFRTFKLKLGPDMRANLEALELLRRVPGLKLRADANQGFTPDALARFLPVLATLGLEFLEEPCEPRFIESLPAARPPIALDETLQGVAPHQLSEWVSRAGASVIVLKPMALGGFCHCLGLSDTARQLGLNVVVTHLFDGPVAMSAARVLALMVESSEFAAGLAEHAGLHAWPRIPNSPFSGAFVDTNQFRERVCPPGMQLPQEPAC